MKKLNKLLILCFCFLVCLVAFVACIRPVPPIRKPRATKNCLSIDFVSSVYLEFNSDGKIIAKKSFDVPDSLVLSQIEIGNDVDDAILTLFNFFKDNQYFVDANTTILFASSNAYFSQKVLSQVSVRFEEFVLANDLSTTAVYQVMSFDDEEISTAVNVDYVSPGKLSLAEASYDDKKNSEHVEIAKQTAVDELLSTAKNVDIQTGYFVLNFGVEGFLTKKEARNIVVQKLKDEGIDVNFIVDDFSMDIFDQKVAWKIDLSYLNDSYRFYIDAINSDVLYSEYRIHSKGENFSVSVLPKDALQTALNNAQLSEDKLYYYNITLEKRDTTPYYAVKFFTEYSSFEYEINANTNSIINYDLKSLSIRDVESKYGLLSYDEAIEIAMERTPSSNISALTVELDYYGGWVYCIEFFVGETYCFTEINAFSGSILTYEFDDSASFEESDYISIKEAKQIVYEIAGMGTLITDDDVSDLYVSNKEIEIEGVDTYVYIIEFYYNEYSFEYTVDASDGIILFENKDYKGNETVKINITEQQAIQIILNKLGISQNQVFVDCNLKNAKGRDFARYYVEFIYEKNYYFYEIDADTGAILKFEKIFI